MQVPLLFIIKWSVLFLILYVFFYHYIRTLLIDIFLKLWFRIPLVKVDDDSTNVKSDQLVSKYLWIFLSSLSLIYNDVHVNTANTIHLLHSWFLGFVERISSGFASTTVSYQLYLTFCMFSYLSWVSYYLYLISYDVEIGIFCSFRSTLPSPNARLDDGLGSLSKRPY